MATTVIELRLENSVPGSAQPYLVRVYDVGVSPERKLAYSETYASKAGARNMAEAVVTGNATYRVFPGQDSKWYWQVKSTNGERLARSARSYSLKDSAQTDADRLKSNAASAVIVDATG